jgi:hypothetical protein
MKETERRRRGSSHPHKTFFVLSSKEGPRCDGEKKCDDNINSECNKYEGKKRDKEREGREELKDPI